MRIGVRIDYIGFCACQNHGPSPSQARPSHVKLQFKSATFSFFETELRELSFKRHMVRFRNFCFKRAIRCQTPLCKRMMFTAKSIQSNYSTSSTRRKLAFDQVCCLRTKQRRITQERIPGQISRLVDGHITKYGLPLEHTAQCTVLLKFGSLTYGELQSFVTTVEDILFKCPAKRDTKPVYKQDEVQVRYSRALGPRVATSREHQ